MPPFFARGLNDTPPDIEARHLALLHAASPARRASLALSLSATVISLARRAIEERMPGASEEQIGLRFVELHYGVALAREVRRYLDSRRT